MTIDDEILSFCDRYLQKTRDKERKTSEELKAQADIMKDALDKMSDKESEEEKE